MGQNNSNPNPSSEEDIRIFTLLQFCDDPFFNIGQIREISHYKEINQPEPEHEFLVVNVVGHRPQSTHWLCVDRSRQEITSILNMSSSKTPAKDTMHVAANFKPLIYTPSSRMSFLQYDAPNEPSLADFRCLLRLVNTLSPEYKLLQEQCYWFCNSIMDIMKEEFPAEMVQEAAYKHKGKIKKVPFPSNAHTMTIIRRAFRSNLKSNAVASISPPRAHSNPHLPRLPYQPNSDPGANLLQIPPQPHWAKSEPDVSLRSLPESHPQPPPQREPHVQDPLISESNLSSLPSSEQALSLDPPPYKNGELIIACKCGDLGQDLYVSFLSDRTLSVSI